MSVRNLSQVTNSFLNNIKKQNPNFGTPQTRENLRQNKPDNNEPGDDQGFINPILTRNDYKETIERYNLHIKKYNLEIWKLNAQVRDYNTQVINFRKGSVSVSDDQAAEEFIWKRKHKDLAPEEYNESVEKYNKDNNGFWLRKKNLKEEVKPASEKVFIAILHELNVQLFNRKEIRHKLDISFKAPIPAVKLYPNKIVSREREGYINLPISKNSFRSHRERLEEAGVLLDYEFSGTKRPVKMRINPEILAVTDNENKKKANTENQTVSPLSSKKVVHSNVSSRKLLDKDKIREKGDFAETSKPDSGKIACSDTENSTGTPKRRNLQKNLKPLPEKTKILLAEIENPEDLAQDLSSGAYNTYRKIKTAALENEALYGAMDQEDFQELAIQDIFCFSAELFKNINAHPGSWVNAIKIWKAEMFRNPNGRLLSKPNILSRWQKYIAVLEAVKKFQEKHPEWEIRYPSLYFDPIRKEKHDSSFAYALRNFRVETAPAKTKQQRELEHLRTSRKVTDLKKAQTKIRLYLRGKMSVDDLFDFVRNNCIRSVYDNLTELIKKEFKKLA